MEDTKAGSGKSRKKIKTLEDALEVIVELQSQVADLTEACQGLNARLAKCEVHKPVNVTREKLVDLISESVRQGNESPVATSVRSIFSGELRSVIRGNQEVHSILADMARQHMASYSVAPEQIQGIREFVDTSVAQNLESGQISFRRGARANRS